MASKLIQNTNTHNQGKIINNYLRNVPCKKRRQSSTNCNKSLIVVTKVNNVLKLQSFLEHNHFGCKPINKV